MIPAKPKTPNSGKNVPRGTIVTQKKRVARSANVPRGTFVTRAHESEGILKTDIVNVRLPARLAVYLRQVAHHWGETPSEYVRGLIVKDMRESRMRL